MSTRPGGARPSRRPAYSNLSRLCSPDRMAAAKLVISAATSSRVHKEAEFSVRDVLPFRGRLSCLVNNLEGADNGHKLAGSKQEAEEGFKLKVAERDERIASMQRQIEELKRKSEQGSQQLQGEVQELELEDLLRAKFPMDVIEPVPKGEFGGDVLQHVMNSAGQKCGTILWETKAHQELERRLARQVA